MTGQLELFVERLPAHPLATDAFMLGVHPLPKVEALQRKYIQPNHRTQTAWIIVDSDRPGAAHDWHLLGAPAPNITVENRSNLHAHLLYGLEVPVFKSPAAHLAPLRYAAAVEWGLVQKLEGDPAYGGLICKNPLSSAWNVQTYENRLYDLDWLADYVDLGNYKDRRTHVSVYGLGRNCTLFENLRKWSYKAIRRNWPDFETWRAAVLVQAGQYNAFPAPLGVADLRSTAKSIASWTWRTFSAEGFREYQRRAARARWGDQVEHRRQLVLDFIQGHPEASTRAAAHDTGLPHRTVRRYLEGCANAISDNCIPPELRIPEGKAWEAKASIGRDEGTPGGRGGRR